MTLFELYVQIFRWISDPFATILIVGSGVVGEANGKALITEGHKVAFIDTNRKIIERFQGEGFTAYLYSKINQVALPNFDIAMLCAPTPFDENINYGSSIGG